MHGGNSPIENCFRPYQSCDRKRLPQTREQRQQATHPSAPSLGKSPTLPTDLHWTHCNTNLYIYFFLLSVLLSKLGENPTHSEFLDILTWSRGSQDFEYTSDEHLPWGPSKWPSDHCHCKGNRTRHRKSNKMKRMLLNTVKPQIHMYGTKINFTNLATCLRTVYVHAHVVPRQLSTLHLIRCIHCKIKTENGNENKNESQKWQ
jgi:hypothetical protein